VGLQSRSKHSLLIRTGNVVAKLAILLALVVGSYTYLKMNAAKPAKEICARYVRGADFTIENFAKEVKVNGILVSSISDGEEKITVDDKTDRSKFAGKPFTGRAAATSVFGMEKFTCEIYVENGHVTETGTRWWD